MRVISGKSKGRKLKEPSDYAIRPTTDMVKESVFNIIQFDIEGRKVLDLFAGTGQLGIECLSRGAAECTFVDMSAEAIALVKSNLKACGLEGRVVRDDSLSFLKRGERYDLIFLDPPYAGELLCNALELIYSVDILNEGGIIVCESPREKLLPEPKSPYRMNREYRYGRVKLTTFGKESTK